MLSASQLSPRVEISSISRSRITANTLLLGFLSTRRTAARYRRPTLVFETLIGKGAYFNYLTTLDDVIASRGGNPLTVDGKVIGAIGVSGGSGSQDNVVSLAGQAALK